MWRTKMILVAGAAAAILAGCSREVEVTRAEAIRAATATVGADRIRAADTEPGNWLAHGRTYDEQRHSPLARINDENAGDLGLAWEEGPAAVGAVRRLARKATDDRFVFGVTDGVADPLAVGPHDQAYADAAKRYRRSRN